MTPCLHIPGRFHHGPCECFTGGDAGEWWHEGLGATETGANRPPGLGDQDAATTVQRRPERLTEPNADERQDALDDRDAMREHYGREEWAG